MIGVQIGAGFCNRVFQMVFAYAYARKHGIPFRFENWDKPSHHSSNVYRWLVERFQKEPNYLSYPARYDSQYVEPYDGFTSYLEPAMPVAKDRNILFSGYFQNERYFLEYREDILRLLAEPDCVREPLEQRYSFYLPIFKESFFLHIRFGDYLYNPKHWVHLETYYLRVIERLRKEMGDNFVLIVFSNQPDLIQQVYPRLHKYLLHRRMIVFPEPDELITFYLMVRCRLGGICANSTYGWWAGWLNQNPQKKVFIPSQWMSSIEDSKKIDIYSTTGMTIVEVGGDLEFDVEGGRTENV